MSRQQTTVIWLGLVLIALNLVIHISDLKSMLFGGSTGKTQGNPVQPPQGQLPTPPHAVAPGPLNGIVGPGGLNSNVNSGPVLALVITWPPQRSNRVTTW